MCWCSDGGRSGAQGEFGLAGGERVQCINNAALATRNRIHLIRHAPAKLRLPCGHCCTSWYILLPPSAPLPTAPTTLPKYHSDPHLPGPPRFPNLLFSRPLHHCPHLGSCCVWLTHPNHSPIWLFDLSPRQSTSKYVYKSNVYNRNMSFHFPFPLYNARWVFSISIVPFLFVFPLDFLYLWHWMVLFPCGIECQICFS